MLFKRVEWAFIIGLALVILVHWKWFFTFDLLSYADWGYTYDETAMGFLNFPFLWKGEGFGQFYLTLNLYPIRFLWSLLILCFGLDFSLIERILFLFPSVILPFVGMYLLVGTFSSKQESKLLGSLFYIFSTYFILNRTRSFTLSVSYGLVPFQIYFYHKFLQEEKFKYFVYTILTSFLLSVYDFRIFYISFFVIFLYLFVHSTIVVRFNLRKFLYNFLYTGLIFLYTFLLNTYWLLGLSKTQQVTSNSLFSRGLFGDSFLDIFKSISFFHPFWNGSKPIWFVVQDIPMFYWVVPIFVFTSILLNIKNRKILFYVLLSVGGIFLAKQSDKPFPEFYLTMYQYFPGFNAFREASKFYFLIAIGYSAILASLLDYLLVFFHKKKYFAYLTISPILLVLIFNIYPIFTGKLKTIFEERHVPFEYLKLKELLQTETENVRTLWIPRDSRWSYFDITRQKASVLDLMNTNLADVFAQNVKRSATTNDRIEWFLDSKIFTEVLNLTVTKYVVIPIADSANDDDFLMSYSTSSNSLEIKNFYSNLLDQRTELLKDSLFTDLQVFENPNPENYIFTFEKLFNLESNRNIDQKLTFSNNVLKQKRFRYVVGGDLPAISLINPFEMLRVQDIDQVKRQIKSLDGKVSTTSKYYFAEYNFGDRIWKTNTSLTFQNYKFTYKNILPNGSFEEGPWKKSVSDCNKYDPFPEISMSIDTKDFTSGGQSLVLAAERHIACTSLQFAVEPGADYLLSFDYKVERGNKASYYVSITGKDKSYVDKENLIVADSNWYSFARVVNIPARNDTMSLFIYADPSGSENKSTVKYDNFSFIKIPKLSNKVFVVNDSSTNMVLPQEVSFEKINPTKSKIHIHGAHGSFFLGLSESFNLGWILSFEKAINTRGMSGWSPFVKVDKIEEKYHFRLNDFLNAWYIDVAKYCQTENRCVKNIDGTFDLELIVEFFPQRWIYFGMLVSGVALFSLVILCVFVFFKQKIKYEKY